MFPIHRCLVLCGLLTAPLGLSAQSASLFATAGDAAARKPFVALRAGPIAPASAASLFAGTQGHSLFAPLPDRKTDRKPDRAAPGGPAFGPLATSTVADQIRHIIAEAESGRAGYDAVNVGAQVKPPRLPTQMTVQEVYDWIAATPGQPHAIGRYQFIPDTLRRLVSHLNVDPQTRFSPALQDRLANQLLIEAGLLAMQRGEITRRSFMYRLAKIWAGLPLPSGASYYQGYAGNKATMTWARFDGAMTQIFPG